MTVPSAINKSGPYIGNGVTDVFDYDFRIVDETHVRVILTDTVGAETTLVLNSDYTVSGVGAPGGGQVTLSIAPATGELLTLIRNAPFVQETDLENQGPYFAETVEDALDLATMRDQQLQEQIDRAVKIPASADPEELDQLIEDIVRISDDASDIRTVANNIGSVVTVAGISGEVTTVAGISGEVTTVAGVAASVPVVAAVADEVAIVAENVSDVTNFSGVYLGARAADPATRTDGSPLQTGDLYFDTSQNAMFVYSGIAWVPAATVSLGGVLNDAGTFGADPDGEVTVGEFKTLLVWLNGVLLREGEDYTQDGSSFTVTNPVEGDEWEYFAVQANDATDYYTKIEADALLAERQFEPYKTVADLLASTEGPRGVGSIWRAQGFDYEEVASDATDYHVETAGGVRLLLLPDNSGYVFVEALGAPIGTTVDAGAFFNTLADICREQGYGFGAAAENTYLLNTSANLFDVEMIDIQSRLWSSNNSIIPLLFGTRQGMRTDGRTRIRSCRWLDGFEVDQPTVRFMAGKNNTILVGRIDYLQFYADTDNIDTTSAAYVGLEGGEVTKLELTTNPAPSGSTTQWINENVFKRCRIRDLVISGTYPHSSNIFEYPDFRTNATLDIDGYSNHIVMARFEGAKTITWGVNSHNNTLEIDWTSISRAAYDVYRPDMVVTDLGVNNQIVSTYHKNAEAVCLFGITPAQPEPTDLAGYETGRVTFGSWNHTVAQNSQPIFTTPPIKLRRGMAWEFRADAALFRPRFFFYTASGNLITSATDPNLLSAASYSWDSGTNSYVRSANTGFVRSAMYIGPLGGVGEPAYCRVAVYTGGSVSGQTFRELALTMFALKSADQLAMASGSPVYA